ncbi:argininosuccinate lyase [Thermovibrio ammonificans HB-1]|uniref:Argininosuccinate lyase n=1 Tax=Thermovibrio ammonificans (strain DSM 15698 / JCM 12110 / HB-1) TaxID=648996 RepID=E8T3I8_THEA1|nr:argininosuccinate lyase [Thermovibrio ammonificans]ADU96119.1 argininosuccinate lyase [Thermovibrio ammonificans HB-1]
MEKKLWGGRFKESTNKLVEQFTESVSYDKRLAPFDIAGSVAHVRMLAKQGILSKEEADRIVEGLHKVLEEVESGKFEWKTELEDVHMNVEKRLTELVGPVGGKLHTGRSRNDQVATDVRLYVRHEIEEVLKLLKELRRAFLKQAEEHIDVVMPGYTHLQIAQPVLYSHHMLAYYHMFKRDEERFRDTLKRVNVSPLGSAALAGTSYPLDREFTAELLGFEGVTRNSMDAVSDRDFVAETIFNCAMVMMHLSRLSEELIIWSTEEFGFIELPDAFCTGSSIMPQKKNPDVSELTRGKTGRVYGDLMAILTILKGLPLTYNRDLQEDKEPLFDALDTVKMALKVNALVVAGMKPKAERMREQARKGFSLATDLADYLAKKGMPFREAHRVVGELVAYCLDTGKELDQLTLEEFKRFSDLFGEDVLSLMSVEGSVNSRNVIGGTAREQVLKEIERIKSEESF